MNEAQAVPKGHPADQMFCRVAEILNLRQAYCGRGFG